MNKRFIIEIMLLLAVVAGLWSCYDDKGNYDYKNLISLQIDTLGIKAEQTAYQFENFNVPVEVKYAAQAANGAAPKMHIQPISSVPTYGCKAK